MPDSATAARVLAILAAQLNRPPSEIGLGYRLVDDLGCESMDLVDIGLRLHQEFYAGRTLTRPAPQATDDWCSETDAGLTAGPLQAPDGPGLLSALRYCSCAPGLAEALTSGTVADLIRVVEPPARDAGVTV